MTGGGRPSQEVGALRNDSRLVWFDEVGTREGPRHTPVLSSFVACFQNLSGRNAQRSNRVTGVSHLKAHGLAVAAGVGSADEDAAALVADDELHHAVVGAQRVLHHVVTHAGEVADGVIGHTHLDAQFAGPVDGGGIGAGEAVPAGRLHGVLGLEAAIDELGQDLCAALGL